MDKIVFLATLAGKLSEYPMPAEEIELSVAQIKNHIDKVSDAEFAAEPATVEDIEQIAKDIYENYLATQQSAEAEVDIPAIGPEQEENAEVEEEALTVEESEETVNTESAEASEEGADTPEEGEEEDPFADILGEIKESGGEISSEELPEIELSSELSEEVISALPQSNEPPAPEDIIEQLDPHAVESPATIESDEDFFEMLAKEAEDERVELARIEELELKALAMASKEEPETVAQVISQDERLAEKVASSPIADEFDPIEGAFDPAQRPDVAFEENELSRVFTEEKDISDAELMVDKEELRTLDDEPQKPIKKKKQKREKVKGSPLFWLLFILTLPITLPIILVICSLFGVAYVAVTALVVTFALAMVACVAVGTALALVGIIYGVTECFGSLPIGLFEIGVGIAIGGVTMLVSVLLYNIAIRWIPKLYKLISRFAAFVFGKIGELYTNIKKECGKKK